MTGQGKPKSGPAPSQTSTDKPAGKPEDKGLKIPEKGELNVEDAIDKMGKYFGTAGSNLVSSFHTMMADLMKLLEVKDPMKLISNKLKNEKGKNKIQANLKLKKELTKKIKPLTEEEKQKLAATAEKLKMQRAGITPGQALFVDFGIVPPVLPKPEKTPEKGKRKPDPYMNAFIFKLESSGIVYISQPPAMWESITKADSKTPYHLNDPVFFKMKDAQGEYFTGGPLLGFVMPDKIRILTRDRNGNPVEKTIHKSKCFIGFTLKKNTQPVPGAIKSTPKKVDAQ